jgi:hypothetical protein
MAEGASPTRQSGRERVQTPKAREQSRWQSRGGSSDTEEIIEVIDSAAPQTKRTEINAHLRDRIVATKVRAMAATAERPSGIQKANATSPTCQNPFAATCCEVNPSTSWIRCE